MYFSTKEVHASRWNVKKIAYISQLIHIQVWLNEGWASPQNLLSAPRACRPKVSTFRWQGHTLPCCPAQCLGFSPSLRWQPPWEIMRTKLGQLLVSILYIFNNFSTFYSFCSHSNQLLAGLKLQSKFDSPTFDRQSADLTLSVKSPQIFSQTDGYFH